MIKRLISLSISLIALVTVFVSGTFFANAATGYTTITISASDIESSTAYSAIQSQLNTAKENATSSNQYKITVAAGDYTLSNSLRIYSNTTLVLTDVTLTQDSGVTANMLKIGEVDDTNSGYYYQNITINGGTWNENLNGNTAMKLAHAKNVTIQNADFENVKNGHFMEIAGVNGLTISNCTYSNQVLNVSSSDATDDEALTYEAIQLDILEQNHFKGYLYEDLANKNITVDSCTFTDVPRGIGSHTAVLNNPIDGLTITGCTFSGISSASIHVVSAKNVTISDNTIKDGPRGIAIYSYQINGTFLASTLASEGGVSSSTSTSFQEASGSNIVISDNTITISGKDNYADYTDQYSGIFVGGMYLSKATTNADSEKIPAGTYNVSGVTISGNKIYTDYHGIRLSYVKKAVITSNKRIEYTGTSGGKYYGISLHNKSSASSIDKNIENYSQSKTNKI